MRGMRGEALHKFGDPSVGDPHIVVPALANTLRETRVDQPANMVSGGRRRDIGGARELADRPGPTVDHG